MKVFISQPMKGKTKQEIIDERESIVDYLKDNGHTIIPSIIVEEYPETIAERVWYLGFEIIEISKADAVYFMDGWENSNGCKIEHAVALEYGLKIIHD